MSRYGSDDDDDRHSSHSGSGGIGFIGLLAAGLTVLFIYLKMTHQIDWAWWKVLLPGIIYISGGVCCCLPILIIICVISGVGILAAFGLGFIEAVVIPIVEWIGDHWSPKKKEKITVKKKVR